MARQLKRGDEIGGGGFGVVMHASFEGEDGIAIDALAVKQLHSELLGNHDAIRRFQREVSLMSSMKHPNVIELVARDLYDTPPWFLMRCADFTLGQLVHNEGLSTERAVTIFRKILSGMAYAHSLAACVVHRDLKPSNILMFGDEPQISDFGLGTRMDGEFTTITTTHMQLGTASYAAPEQFKGSGKVGPRADVYALGKIFGEMLTVQTPIPGRPNLQEYPEEFRGFIGRCTEDDPLDRYSDAGDALAALDALVLAEDDTLVGTDFQARVAAWEAANSQGARKAAAKAVAKGLMDRRADEEFMTSVFPRLDRALIDELMASRADDFDVLLSTFDSQIQGSLGFSYCDVVADFYRAVFKNVRCTTKQKRVILDRLIELGPSHNRWHVGEVVGDLLVSMKQVDRDIAVRAAEAAAPRDREWNWELVKHLALAAPLRDAFAAQDDLTRDRDAVPF